MGTLVAFILAILVLVLPLEIAANVLPFVVVSVAVGFLLAIAIGHQLTAGFLQKAVKGPAPRAIELYNTDWFLKALHAFILTWAASSILLAIIVLPGSSAHLQKVAAVWLILTGCAIDCTGYAYRRVLSYLNPIDVTQLVHEEANREVAKGRDVELCGWIDSLADTSIWAIRRDNTSVCSASLDAIRMTLQHYLSWNRRALKGAALDAEAHQRANYILHYAFDRLALLYNTALEKHLDLSCSYVISTLGKVSVTAADADISLVPYGVRYIGSLSKKGVQAHFDGAGLKAILTLVQVSKLILSDHDIAQKLIEKPFIPILRAMEEIAKECFRQDKSMALHLLTNPFQELKAIFQHERFTTHPDTPAILKELDRILGDFANLELVLRTIPPIPDVIPPPEVAAT